MAHYIPFAHTLGKEQTALLDFAPEWVIINNPANGWIFFPQTKQWIGPGAVGTIYPFTLDAGSAVIDSRFDPAGNKQTLPPVPVASIVFSDDPKLKPTSGSVTQITINNTVANPVPTTGSALVPPIHFLANVIENFTQNYALAIDGLVTSNVGPPYDIQAWLVRLSGNVRGVFPQALDIGVQLTGYSDTLVLVNIHGQFVEVAGSGGFSEQLGLWLRPLHRSGNQPGMLAAAAKISSTFNADAVAIAKAMHMILGGADMSGKQPLFMASLVIALNEDLNYGALPAAGKYTLYSLNPWPSVLSGKLNPAQPNKVAQELTGMWAGNGVPNNADGDNGDFYFRGDGAAGTFIYHKAAGVWAAFA